MTDNNLQNPFNQGFDIKKPNSIGQDFIEWAEKYWHIDNLIQGDNQDIFNGEVCDYKYMRNIFIQKINGLIKERLGITH
jgi:hypothetical protein